MIFLPTPIPGAWMLDLERREDERGFFARAFCADEFRARGLNPALVQANLSFSRRRGTLRGMHYQSAPAAEAKLVRCVRGAVFDVVADLRPDSPACRRWHGCELSAENRRALLVPEGCAHGFLTLEDDCEVFYQVSHSYSPAHERGFRFDDPAVGIAWPAEVVVISAKDLGWEPLGPPPAGVAR